MRPAFLRGLLIAFAAAGACGAVIGAAVGPKLLHEALGIYIRPIPRLTIGAVSLVIWTALGAAIATWLLDRDRPVRGTFAKVAAVFQVETAVVHNVVRMAGRVALVVSASIGCLMGGIWGVGAPAFADEASDGRAPMPLRLFLAVGMLVTPAVGAGLGGWLGWRAWRS